MLLHLIKVILIGVVLSNNVLAQLVRGKVVAIVDGDTLTVLTDEKRQVKIRIYGIDAPESKQPFGTRARQNLGAMAHEKEAVAEVIDTDRYGRSIARVKVGTIDLGEAQVAAGLAWWYREYARKDEQLRGLEAEARTEKRGLWSEPNPVAPWEWRRQKRSAAAKANN